MQTPIEIFEYKNNAKRKKFKCRKIQTQKIRHRFFKLKADQREQDQIFSINRNVHRIHVTFAQNRSNHVHR